MTKSPLYALAAALLLASCGDGGPVTEPLQPADGADSGIYLSVDLPEAADGTESRLAFDYSQFYYQDGSGNLTARWELGDIIKVYETKAGGYTHVYADYDAYQNSFPYPLAPVKDVYYRFECVGGEGTAHGLFRYVGLTTAVVEAGADGTYNVDLDIIYNHEIANWEKFDGLVIYGNPLRKYMMRHQSDNRSMTHLKYGERMKGTFCGYNFGGWTGETGTAGARGLLLYNTSGCIYRIKMGRFKDNIYGGAELTLDMPGITSGHDQDGPLAVLNSPMTLTLGDAREHQEDFTPWAAANYQGANPDTDANTITAYIVGWPGTLAADAVATVTLKDNFYNKKYVWTLSKSSAIKFEEGKYYTFDLTDDTYVYSDQ